MNEFEKLLKNVEDESMDSQQKTLKLMKNTPYISDDVYDTLPKIFGDIINKKFHEGNKRKKDIMLLSSLATLSSQFPSVQFNWWWKNYAPNLYFFLAAKSGQGKSLMGVGKELLYTEISKQKSINIQLQEKYKDELKIYLKDKKNNEKPEEPVMKNVMFSGNISSAEMINQIGIETSLLYDTEADAMSNSMKQDWGDYSTTIRKCFEHEIENKMRVGSDVVDINEPKLSVCVSGTLNQAVNVLASNIENGLFNRFMTYIYAEETVYEEFTMEGNGITINDYYHSLSHKISAYINKYKNDFNYKVYFSNDDMKVFHKWQRTLRKKAKYYEEKDIDGILKRYAIITLRIATLFTIFRQGLISTNTPDIEKIITIRGELVDLKNAISIATTLIDHTKLLFYSFEDKQTILRDPSKKQKAVNLIMKKMKKTFTKSELERMCEEEDISIRTAQRATTTLVDGGDLIRIKKGVYQKKR